MARINEIGDTEKGQYALGRLRGRKFKREGFQKANEIGKYAEKAREKASFNDKEVDGKKVTVHSPSKYNNLTDSHANGWHDEMHSKNESKEMNNQIKLTESELHGIIEGAVKSLIREYMPDLIGAGVARGIRQGKLGPYNAAQRIMQRDRWDKDQMAKFQDGFEGRLEDGTNLEEYTTFDKEKMYGKNYDEDFEDLNDSPVNSAVDGSLEDEIAFENKKPIKVNESQLFDIIKESVQKILKEGQGWNLFKDTYNGLKNGEYDDALMKGDYPENDEEYKQDRNDFINHTGMFKDEPYYDSTGHYQYNNTFGDNKKVNNGLMGKLGRRAGAFGSEMALKARRNKLNRMSPNFPK